MLKMRTDINISIRKSTNPSWVNLDKVAEKAGGYLDYNPKAPIEDVRGLYELSVKTGTPIIELDSETRKKYLYFGNIKH